MMLNMLVSPKMYGQFFHRIYVFSPTVHIDTKWRRLNLPKEHKFATVTHKDIIDIMLTQYTRLILWRKQGLDDPRVLVIFEDCGAEAEMRGHLYANPVDELMFNCRHLKISVWFSVQNMVSLSVPTRTNMDGMILFQTTNYLQIQTVYKEWGHGALKDFKALMENCTSGKFEFLFINRQGPAIEYFRTFKYRLHIVPNASKKQAVIAESSKKRPREWEIEESSSSEQEEEEEEQQVPVEQQEWPTEHHSLQPSQDQSS